MVKEYDIALGALRGKMVTKFRTHYDNLQVVETASIEVIRGAYKYLSQKWHPDKHPNDKERATRIMKVINDAYSVLSDPERRREHDAWIRAQREQFDNAKASQSEKVKETPPPEHEEKQNANEGVYKPDESREFFGGKYHPWRRYFARTVDLFTSGIISLFLALVLIESFSQNLSASIYSAMENELIAGLMLCVVWIPIEAVFLATIATTPAKWVFGIKVRKADGTKLSFSDALSRSFLVWVQGMGFAIPIVLMVTNYLAYKRLTKSGVTLWDKSVGAIVEHKQWSFLRVVSVVFITFCSFMLIAVLDKQNDQTKYASTVAASANNTFGFYFENKCNHPLSLVLHYQGGDGIWYTQGGWNIHGGFSGYLQDEKGNNLRTSNAVWYYYAKTTDSSNWEWAGEHYFEYAGVNLPMIRLEDTDGDSNWSTTCP